jgi:hypothetical protein
MDTKIYSNNLFSVKNYYDFAAKVGAEIITIGYSAQNRPIQVLKKGSGKNKILFIARIHGNEPATTQALLEFFNENDFNNLVLYGIFLSNPDGAALYEELWLKNPEAHWTNNFPDARLNSNKVDINRDWYDLGQPETRAIHKFIFDLHPDFAVDFHEYYWSDKGYPPKNPLDDEDGFLATMTDAPFLGADEFVKAVSKQMMDKLVLKLEKEFNLKIKLRHFVGASNKTYPDPIVIGIYLALRGIPKLLVETWGTACSTLRLTERLAFHKKAMKYIIDWINENSSVFMNKQVYQAKIEFDLNSQNRNNIDSFTEKLNVHGFQFNIKDNKSIIIYCTSTEIGFIKTIYNKIFE